MSKRSTPTANASPDVDKQEPQTGKVENDNNKQGNQKPTQKHEAQRTPQSRSDRESHIGGNNQNQSRRGGGGNAGGGGAG
ncbi:MAG: hypothetical protein V4684_08040 [Pseudomonadota bacterium]